MFNPHQLYAINARDNLRSCETFLNKLNNLPEIHESSNVSREIIEFAKGMTIQKKSLIDLAFLFKKIILKYKEIRPQLIDNIGTEENNISRAYNAIAKIFNPILR